MTARRIIQLTLLLALAGIFTLAGSIAARADVTYTYTGNAFTQFNQSYACPPVCRITASFTVAQPLAANLPFQQLAPISYTVTDGLNTFTEHSLPPLFYDFGVSTDANGNISKWYIEVHPPDFFSHVLYTCGTGNCPSGLAFTDWTADVAPNNGPVTNYAYNHDSPGMWSQGPAAPPPTSFSLFASTAIPAVVNANAGAPLELGMRFTSDRDGSISGVRFYKGASNLGIHIASLWTSTGTLLAQATFMNETASGWQQVAFSAPVAIVANTVYVVSYHSSAYFSYDQGYFNSPVDNPPLHAVSGASGNGVYSYGASSVFPVTSSDGVNFWVDVVFSATNTPPPTGPFSLFASTAIPAVANANAGAPLELGMRFTSDRDGSISAVRFYKGASNVGTHVASLWTSTGTLLAQATFMNETASGWQQVAFSAPVAIAANTVYVVSYHSSAYFSYDLGYFNPPLDNPPLHAVSGASGNGVYSYGASSVFPVTSSDGANFWVDVVFSATSTAKVDTIGSVTSGGSPTNPNLYWGETITTIAGGPWNNLSFNFYSGSFGPSLTPLAQGHVFLLSQAYSGSPAALSSSTAGFIAEGTASGGQYHFSASATVSGTTKYWIYTDTALPSIMGGAIDPSYTFYYASSTFNFGPGVSGSELDYSLMGTPVAEPGLARSYYVGRYKDAWVQVQNAIHGDDKHHEGPSERD